MTGTAHSIDVIIPTYRPDERLIRCLELLGAQTVAPSRIHIVNTEQRFFDELMENRVIPASVRDITEITHISAREFDHGGQRCLRRWKDLLRLTQKNGNRWGFPAGRRSSGSLTAGSSRRPMPGRSEEYWKYRDTDT